MCNFSEEKLHMTTFPKQYIEKEHMTKADIAIARGDGIGPEIMAATLAILEAAQANITLHEIEIGQNVYLKGFQNGIDPKSWDIIHATQAFLKAPVTTPQGGGFRSLNVAIRAALGLYANIRPCIAYDPFVDTKYPGMDVVVIRENEEDLYTGVEYRHTQDCYHAIKMTTRQGCEKIIRYAFEYARQNNRKKVTCFTKDNILKMTDGLFHAIYDACAKEYPEIEHEHWIIDIGAAKLTDTPQNFDVIVLSNLYGDILSDITAQIAGSVGLAGSANIGERGAMFEAIHGSAPRRAGQNLANPSGLIMAAIMLLEYLDDIDTATLIHNAWLKTIEEGIHTYDIFEEGKSSIKVGTKEFAHAVISRLGKMPEKLASAKKSKGIIRIKEGAHLTPPHETKRLVGADIYIDASEIPLEGCIRAAQAVRAEVTFIANRGLVLYPHAAHLRSVTINQEMKAHFRCRFLAKGDTDFTPKDIISLQEKIISQGLDVTKYEGLYTFGEKPGFRETP